MWVDVQLFRLRKQDMNTASLLGYLALLLLVLGRVLRLTAWHLGVLIRLMFGFLDRLTSLIDILVHTGYLVMVAHL